MRKPVDPGTPEEAWRRRRRLMWVTVAAVGVVVGSVLAYVALQPGPPLRILSVSVSPEPGVPDQPLTVTAHIQGGTFLRPVGVSADYVSFFAYEAGGGGGLYAKGGDTYSGTVGPFPNGTAVWIVVVASDGQSTRSSNGLTVDVGLVPEGGPSGLRLTTVVLDPPQPTSLDMPKVTVNVTSAANVTSVTLAYVGFSASGGGSGMTAMFPTPSGDYYIPLFGTFGGTPSGMTTVGAVWMYRIGAEDSTGNTVLSPIYNFTVASPTG